MGAFKLQLWIRTFTSPHRYAIAGSSPFNILMRTARNNDSTLVILSQVESLNYVVYYNEPSPKYDASLVSVGDLACTHRFFTFQILCMYFLLNLWPAFVQIYEKTFMNWDRFIMKLVCSFRKFAIVAIYNSCRCFKMSMISSDLA